MWTSKDFRTYKKRFDFSSSELGERIFTALRIEDDDFINMIEALDGEIGDNQVFQTIVCDACGTYRCASGSWVAIRRSGRYVFFIPAFEEILGDEDKSMHYDPPYLLEKKGAFWLADADFADFKHLVPEIDGRESIIPMSKQELVWLFMWDTPGRLFGQFPGFTSLRWNDILAFSDLEVDYAIGVLKDLLRDLEACTRFELKEISPSDTITLGFFNDSSITEWKSFCRSNNSYFLLLGGVFKIVLG